MGFYRGSSDANGSGGKLGSNLAEGDDSACVKEPATVVLEYGKANAALVTLPA